MPLAAAPVLERVAQVSPELARALGRLVGEGELDAGRLVADPAEAVRQAGRTR